MLKNIFPLVFETFQTKSLKILTLLFIFINLFFINPQGTIMSDPVLKTTINIVDKGTLEIHPHSGIDISTYNDKFYSGLPLGASILALPTYFIFQKIIELIPEKYYPKHKIPAISPRLPFEYDKKVYFLQILLVVTTILPLFLIFYFSFLEYLLFMGFSKAKVMVLSILFSMGSFHFSYQTVYSRQLIAGFLIWIGFLLFERHKTVLNKLTSFILGLMICFSLWIDYFSFLILIPLIIYWLIKEKDKRNLLIFMAMGGFIWGLGIAFHHYYLFENLLKTPYHFRIGFHPDYIYPVEYGKRIFYSNDQKLLKDVLYFNGINLKAFYGLIFSRFKGILWFSPNLLLWSFVISQWGKIKKPFLQMSIGMVLIFLVNFIYLLGIKEEYFWSGVPSFWGPRYFILSSFFIFLPIIFVDFNSKFKKIVLNIVFGFSLFVNFLGASFSFLLKDKILLDLDSVKVFQITQDPIWENLKIMLFEGWNSPLIHFLNGGLLMKITSLILFFIVIFSCVWLFCKNELK